MLNLTGPAPISPVTQPEDLATGLRLNQRIAAEVMRINGDRVVISVQGVPIVAQLTSAEQAAVLIEHQHHTFVVQEASAGKVLLRLLQPVETPTQGGYAPAPDWLANLLEKSGLPPTPEHMQLARAMLAHNLPITPGSIGELKQVLLAAGDSSPDQVQAAAWLKSLGIPLTPGSLELAVARWPDFAGQYGELMSRLRLLAGNADLPGELAQVLRLALEAMEKAVVRPDLPVGVLAGRLQATAGIMGQSVENQLFQFLLEGRKAGPGASAQGLPPDQLQGSLLFSHLQGELSRHGQEELAEMLRDMLDYLRWLHLLSQDRPDPGRSRWAVLEIPIHFTQPAFQGPPDLSNAQLRIAYGNQSGPDLDTPGHIDPGYTRLLIQVDLPGEGDPALRRLQMDLSLYRRLVRADVTASNPDLGSQAQAGLHLFAEGLQKLGYTLQAASVQVGSLPELEGLHPPEMPSAGCGVDVEA
jgi:hypothetical protein